MNWGHKIIAVYVVFIAGMIFLVFKSSRQNIELVTEDYYAKELVYQQKIDELCQKWYRSYGLVAHNETVRF